MILGGNKMFFYSQKLTVFLLLN